MLPTTAPKIINARSYRLELLGLMSILTDRGFSILKAEEVHNSAKRADYDPFQEVEFVTRVLGWPNADLFVTPDASRRHLIVRIYFSKDGFDSSPGELVTDYSGGSDLHDAVDAYRSRWRNTPRLYIT